MANGKERVEENGRCETIPRPRDHRLCREIRPKPVICLLKMNESERTLIPPSRVSYPIHVIAAPHCRGRAWLGRIGIASQRGACAGCSLAPGGHRLLDTYIRSNI